MGVRSVFRPLTILLAGLLVGGCPGEEDQRPPLQCAIDSECAFGTFCADGACVEGCVENGDCGYAQPCIDGACDPTPGACNAPFYCPFGAICEETTRRCRSSGASNYCDPCIIRYCLAHRDCPVGLCLGFTSTSFGECATACGAADCRRFGYSGDEVCGSDADCGLADNYCVKSPCFDDDFCRGLGLGTCNTWYEPGGGRGSLRACSVGICKRNTCIAECSTDEQCGRGFRCARLFSTTEAIHTPCQEAGECGAGRPCVHGGEGISQPVCGCLSDGECSIGKRCLNNLCIINTFCDPAVGLTCDQF